MIDLAPMANAVNNLTEALQLVDTTEASKPIRLLLRAGLIQTFEYNYELAIAMMTRYLNSVELATTNHDLGVFEELIRVADLRGLVLSPYPAWRTYRQARNRTSHTYDETKALAVVEVIPAFEKDVIYLLARLQEKVGR